MAKLSFESIPFEKIADLNRAYRILICAVVFVGLAAGFYYLFYQPKQKELNDLEQKLAGIHAKLTGAKSAAANLEDFEQEYKKAQIDFKIALRLLPDKKEIPTLLESVSRSGKDSGLEFILFQPRKEEQADFYAKIPVDIEVHGGFHNVAMFFDRIARLPRIVNIPKFDLQIPKGGGAGLLTTKCVAETYRFLEAGETGQAENGQKDKKKKG